MQLNEDRNNEFVEHRDVFFWQKLHDVCMTYQKKMVNQFTPLLAKIGVLNLSGTTIRVNINDSDPVRSFYPIIELSLYPCAVFAAALHEYVPKFTREDEYNLKKYIFSTADEMLHLSNQLGENTRCVLVGRLKEYAYACKEDLLSGYSLYGQFGMDFEGLKDWSENHQVKCAHLLCDYIAYIKHFGKSGTYEELNKLRPFVINNTEQTLKSYMDLFNELYAISRAIFKTVRYALNRSEKSEVKEGNEENIDSKPTDINLNRSTASVGVPTILSATGPNNSKKQETTHTNDEFITFSIKKPNKKILLLICCSCIVIAAFILGGIIISNTSYSKGYAAGCAAGKNEFVEYAVKSLEISEDAEDVYDLLYYYSYEKKNFSASEREEIAEEYVSLYKKITYYLSGLSQKNK